MQLSCAGVADLAVHCEHRSMTSAVAPHCLITTMCMSRLAEAGLGSLSGETHGMQDWLVKLPDLAGLWGMERFGLTDIKILRALEGLEGVEQCASYKLIEERSTVAAEKARLEKLVQSKSKQVCPHLS